MSSRKKSESYEVDPPPFDPLQPATPVSYPIKTLEELESRAYFESFHYLFNKSSVPLKILNTRLENRPRVLVCHDFKGGYTDDDKWVQGGSNENAYAIWHWYLIDVFVYFAHYLVTLPPPSWTNAAHAHGVKVLGTFITEGTEGRKICDKVLATKQSAQLYAERLAELATNLGFDGWLMNIEVTLDAGQIPNLKEFVSHLTQVMHSSVPGSLIIWYDSVTITGELSYQNQLNDQNKPFFDICDGIFANYWWEENYPKQSAEVAGDRKYDVYMGVDVWGRGTFGGGEWNTNVALDVCKKEDVSTAIFAPGWVYETDQPPDFQTAQNKWWNLVEKSWGVVKLYPISLPFYSNFDQGHGFHISSEGGKVSNSPWTNISSQGFQPFLEFKDNPNPDSIQVFLDFKGESYSGGANITFKGTIQGNNEFTTRLFKGNLLLGKKPLYMTYSVRSDPGSLIGLSFLFSSATNETTKCLISTTHQETNDSLKKFDKAIASRRIDMPKAAPGWTVQESSIEMNGYTLTEIHAVCYRPNPETQKTIVNGNGHDNLVSSPSHYYAAIGDIRIKDSKENPIFPSPSSWLVEGQNIKWSSGPQGSKNFSGKILWKLKDGCKLRTFSKYNIYVVKIPKNARGRVEGVVHDYIGVAFVEAFYVSGLSVDPSNISSLKFIIQACSVDGVFQNLEDSPFLQLEVKASHHVAITIPNNGENDAILGRRHFKNNNHQKLMRYDDFDKEGGKYVLVDMLIKIGKIILGRGIMSWSLLIFLVILYVLLWVFNHNLINGFCSMR